jgi:2-phospho-L-lactate transferase/gluconeogenesis factor (CofD/UPF0052 family)
VLSFGYKYGLPVDADLVVDCRFLPNPHWVPELRPAHRPDAAVRDYVLGQPGAREFLDRYEGCCGCVSTATRARASATRCSPSGCTGGKHRSVAMSEQLRRGCRATGSTCSRPPRPGARVSSRAGAARPTARGRRARAAGHGPAASLQALRRVTPHVTAVVTVADDGGSSGRLRDELGRCRPATCAWRCRRSPATTTGADLGGAAAAPLRGDGPLAGPRRRQPRARRACARPPGDPVRALDLVGRLVGAVGRVLPMSCEPLEIVAEVVGLDAATRRVAEVVGPGRRRHHARAGRRGAPAPAEPPACAEAVAGGARAPTGSCSGPGSWFTSVLPHLLVPELRAALETTPRAGWSPQPRRAGGGDRRLLARGAPRGARRARARAALDVVLADEQAVRDRVVCWRGRGGGRPARPGAGRPRRRHARGTTPAAGRGATPG